MSVKFLSLLRSILRLFCLFSWLFLAAPFQLFLALLPPFHPLRQTLVQSIFKGVCLTLGLKIRTLGEPIAPPPCLFVSNHISYMDILVLGATLKASFVSKAEVKKWPIFGFYATLQGAIFIKRTKTTLLQQKSLLLERLEQGGSLILFPEGTTHTGIHVLPFKSSLFESVEHPSKKRNIKVQPLSLSYTHVSGLPLGRNERIQYAWFGNLSLLPHVISLVSQGPIIINIHLHPPILYSEMNCRKEIALVCNQYVSKGVAKKFQAP